MGTKGIGPQGLGNKGNNGFWVGDGSTDGISNPNKTNKTKNENDMAAGCGCKKSPAKMCGCSVKSPAKKTGAWARKEGKDPKGGLNAKGVAAYRAANPGSKLQTAVTKKPSELKAGSKDANRRKSFCARMSGMPGPMKKPNGEPTRKKLALDKWNC